MENPEEVSAWQVRMPKTAQEAVARFQKKRQVYVNKGQPMISWEEAVKAIADKAKAQVLRNQLPEVTEYMRGLYIEEEALGAAIEHAQWLADAGCRMSPRAGIMVDEIPMEEFRPCLGRGAMLGLKEVPIAQGQDSADSLHRAAWSRSTDGTFEGNRLRMQAAVLRQICHRTNLGMVPSRDEKRMNRIVGRTPRPD